MTSPSARALTESLDRLSIKQSSKARSTSNPTTSWEDEVDEDESSTQAPRLAAPIAELPEAPPTSPMSPSVRTKATSHDSPYQTFPPYGMNGSLEYEDPVGPASSKTSAEREDVDKRPEKTTAAAARLIAAGIGQRPVRRTEEEKKYDQAMRVQEKKRRDAAKEEAARADREKEKAKIAIWED